MKISEFDFCSLTEITECADIISVEKIDKRTTAKKRAALYFQCQKEQTKYCGLLVLGLYRTKYDLSFFKQRLEIAFERACFRIIKWEEDESEGKLYFEIEERQSIIVNGANTLISLEHVFNDGLNTAKDLKEVSHYTTIKAAVAILEKQEIQAKSLSRYKSEAGFSINENSRRLAFFTSFSRNTSISEEMWRRFGDKHRGCKIDFCFSHSFWRTFAPSQALRALDENGIEYEISTNRGLTNALYVPGVWIKTLFVCIGYSPIIKNNSTLEIQETGPCDFTIIENIGKWVSKKYDYQDEARIVMLS